MTLAALLKAAGDATPDRQIETRDAIAAHGVQAIEGVRPWLTDDVLAAFAVRVIERVGLQGEPELAAKVLRSARTKVPAGVSDDVEWALQQLRAAVRPTPQPVVRATRVAPIRRAAAPLGTTPRRRAG